MQSCSEFTEMLNYNLRKRNYIVERADCMRVIHSLKRVLFIFQLLLNSRIKIVSMYFT